MTTYTNVLAALDLMGPSQRHAVIQGMRGEERAYFADRLNAIGAIFAAMPETYETDGQGMNAVVHLHYFRGAADWYITERDQEPEQHQAFGWANLGDDDNAEFGYISLLELAANNVELDLHFTPAPLGEVLAGKRGIK